LYKRLLNWIIVGGETGPGARPMDPDWARGVRDQCAAAGVPFFFKRMGQGQPTPGEWPKEA
jgi:protein gp37